MKKLLLFKKMIIVVLLVGLSSAGWAQLLYEGFNYATPAYIGGNGDAGSTSNNWTTHSVTAGQTTTIDIQDGSLTYPGLASSTGNKVFLFSNSNATSRDVNRAFSSTATTLYYSALVNIIDNSQIAITADNYFIHFGASSGAVNTTFGARVGVVKSADGATFRFIILNTSGGSPVYSDNGIDMNFGTTYLVVAKYDISSALTVATLWVNPASLGGAEPAGGISNSTGSNAFTSFATGSICLRNNAATPKAYIDEIRVGATWAEVTPTGNVGINIREQTHSALYPNPATTFFSVNAPEGKYMVYVNNSIGSLVKTTELNSTGKIDISDLHSGIYYVTVENLNTKLKEVQKLIIR